MLVHALGKMSKKTVVPVSWLPRRSSRFIALQRPSSVGIRPAKYLIERIISRRLNRLPTDKLSKTVLTVQLVAVQPELPHIRAQAEFRRNVACAVRRPLEVKKYAFRRAINRTTPTARYA